MLAVFNCAYATSEMYTLTVSWRDLAGYSIMTDVVKSDRTEFVPISREVDDFGGSRFRGLLRPFAKHVMIKLVKRK